MLSDEIDYGQMTALASEFGLTESVADTLKAVLSDKGALSLYGRKVNTKALLKRVAGLNP